MSNTQKRTVTRSKTRSKAKVVRFALEPRKVMELRRALMLAMHHTMSTAKPEERSAAAMEAADYKMLDEWLASEMVKQGFVQPTPPPATKTVASAGEVDGSASAEEPS